MLRAAAAAAKGRRATDSTLAIGVSVQPAAAAAVVAETATVPPATIGGTIAAGAAAPA